MKDVSLSLFALDFDLALVGLDNAVHDGQAESRPLPFRFGGEKGIEDMIQILFRDAETCIPHCDEGPMRRDVPFRDEA